MPEAHAWPASCAATSSLQVVSAAESVGRLGVGAVGREAVVHGDPAEAGEHAGVVHRVGAALLMDGVAREHLGGGGVRPAQPLSDPQPGLVVVRDRLIREQAAQLLIELGETRSGLAAPTSTAWRSRSPPR